QFLILYDLAYDIGNLVAYDYALAVVQNQRRVGLGFYGFDLIRVYDEVFSVQFGHFYHGGFTSLPFYLTGSRDFNAHAAGGFRVARGAEAREFRIGRGPTRTG